MIRFIKELYLTAFTVLYRKAAFSRDTQKVGSATAFITLIEWLNLVDILCWIDVFGRKQFMAHFSTEIYLAWIPIGILNIYFLKVRGHGIKFEGKFDKLEKSRKILLKVSCAVVLVATIVFTVCSLPAHRHFMLTYKP